VCPRDQKDLVDDPVHDEPRSGIFRELPYVHSSTAPSGLRAALYSILSQRMAANVSAYRGRMPRRLSPWRSP